jgi:ATP-dependent DNA helicase RecQ
MLNDEEAGLDLVADLMNQIVSPNEAVKLRGSIARSLETYPDHPGLLLLRSLSEALARDTDEQTVVDNFQGFLSKGRDAYALSPTAITQGAALALRYVSRKDKALACSLESIFLDHESDRQQLRLLIADSGIQASTLAPWALLEKSLITIETRSWPSLESEEGSP